MKVYVVEFQGIDEGNFEAVFSTRDKAQAFIDQHMWQDYLHIIEAVVDEVESPTGG